MTELDSYRNEIDRIDSQIQDLFEERLKVAAGIAAYKKARNLPVTDSTREEAKIRALRERASSDGAACGIERVFRTVMAVTRDAESGRLVSSCPGEDASGS